MLHLGQLQEVPILLPVYGFQSKADRERYLAWRNEPEQIQKLGGTIADTVHGRPIATYDTNESMIAPTHVIRCMLDYEGTIPGEGSGEWPLEISLPRWKGAHATCLFFEGRHTFYHRVDTSTLDEGQIVQKIVEASRECYVVWRPFREEGKPPQNTIRHNHVPSHGIYKAGKARGVLYSEEVSNHSRVRTYIDFMRVYTWRRRERTVPVFHRWFTGVSDFIAELPLDVEWQALLDLAIAGFRRECRNCAMPFQETIKWMGGKNRIPLTAQIEHVSALQHQVHPDEKNAYRAFLQEIGPIPAVKTVREDWQILVYVQVFFWPAYPHVPPSYRSTKAILGEFLEILRERTYLSQGEYKDLRARAKRVLPHEDPYWNGDSP